MNASLLNALSAAISDNPVHVLQLRKIVVALAISGRLNAVDTSIGHAEILALLGDVKRRHISQRVLAKQKPNVAITPDQLPEDFTDPSKFISLGHIARVEKGKTGIQQAKPGPYPLVVTAAERITADHYDFDGAAAIIPLVSSTGHGNASINRLHYQEGQFALGTILAAVLPHDQALFSARFLFEYLSAFKEELLVSRMTGTANVTLTLGRIEEVPIPLVSPVIQQQVDQLMALCDEMEAARTERETKRDRLAAASLARLNTPDLETFRDDARFALDALPALTARPDQIKQLRQTILNLAVRGKLVPQDLADEPAERLLERISTEKKRLMAEKGIRGQKPALPAENFEMDADIPGTWRHVYLQDIAYQITDGTHLTPRYTETGKPFLSAQNVKPFRFMPEKHRFVSEQDFDSYRSNRRPERGDILLTRVGAGIGEAAVLDSDFEFAFYVSLCLVKVPTCCINVEYLVLWLNSPEGRDSSSSRTYGKGASQGNLNLGLIRTFKIPLPPLAEQHRIVAKVDELMALCDQLEASLTSADETRKKLLDALLAEALMPTETVTLQAAAE